MKNWSRVVMMWLCLTATAAIAKPPTATFDFGFDDTSLQGEMQGARADEHQRLDALNAQLRDMLVKSGCCSIVDIGRVAKRAHDLDMRTCNGCDVDLAREVGARISVTGWVQKVSNLILNINVVARDVTSGKVIEAGSVDIRGNTDESWSRGLSYLLRERLHPAEWR
ncbi:MAG: hypothetical protein QOH05_4245 [Acetobacteraceae bacterium]|nr:hypothetical protein [Acetobacteraceae bacterium]